MTRAIGLREAFEKETGRSSINRHPGFPISNSSEFVRWIEAKAQECLDSKPAATLYLDDDCPSCKGEAGHESGGVQGWVSDPCTCHPMRQENKRLCADLEASEFVAQMQRDDADKLREMIRQSRLPHGSCKTNACTACDAQKFLDEVAEYENKNQSVSGPTPGQCDEILGKVHYSE